MACQFMIVSPKQTPSFIQGYTNALAGLGIAFLAFFSPRKLKSA
jgi:hypothetical protein